MTKNEKSVGHGNYDGEGENATESEKFTRGDKVPFNGAMNSDHPHDPFRNDFGGSSLKFEF